MAMNDLNSQAMNLKEEIRAVFLRHKKSLASRETWLLDQVDSIKEAAMLPIIKQQASMEGVKGQMEECTNFMKFSEEHEFSEGVTRASDVMAQLQKKVQECNHMHSPVIKFVHDSVQLRDSILCYGRLQTQTYNDTDDTDSFLTEKSWDLVDERSDNEEKEDECSPVKHRCCGVATACCQPSYEIEDMDFSAAIIGDNLCQEQLGPDFDRSEILRKFCKANELCCSISECVCDTPCVVLPQKNAMDPVDELHNKLTDVYSSHSGQHEEIPDVEKSTSTITCIEDPVIQVTNAVNHILGAVNDQSSIPVKRTSSAVSETDIVCDLNAKLQKIIDGNVETESVAKETNFYQFTENVTVENKSLPWEISTDESEKKYRSEQCDSMDEVEKLHRKLEEIYHKDVVGGPIPQLKEEIGASDKDPVNLLSKQLQHLLAY